MRQSGRLAGVFALSAVVAALPISPSDAAPLAPGSGCGTSAQSLNPATPNEQTLVSYFEALNAKDYPTAWNFLGDEVQSTYGSEQRYAEVMDDHVSCVRLLGVRPFGAHAYLVDLAAEYVTPFPAGSGTLPGFWTIDDGTIVEVGTGP